MTSRRRRVPREVRSRPVGRILFVGLRRVEDQKREGRVLRRNTQSREDQLEPSAAMRDLGPRRPTATAMAGREVAQMLCAEDGERFVTTKPPS